MTEREKEVIEVLRMHVSKTMGEDIQHESYPEEIGVPNGERPCDAIWRGACSIYAVEHTTIDSFLEQRHDDDRFRRLMGKLEKEWSNHPDDWLEITIEIGAIPNGVDWDELSNKVKEWLIQNVPSLPCDRQSLIRIPSVPFDFSIYRERVAGQGRVIVARNRPQDIPKQIETVIRSALDKKIGVLQQYKNKGYATILLIESSDFILVNRDSIFKALLKAYRHKIDSTVFDQIYVITTGTSTWCIVPFKVGLEIEKEPEPYWPTDSNYPLGPQNRPS